MAIIRSTRPSDSFAQIKNDAIEDGRLTAKARGVLAYLLSRPPGWQTSSDKLAASAAFQRDGRDAIRTALQELEKFGYLVRKRSQSTDGKWQWDQHVTDEPTIDGFSNDGSSDDGSSADGKPGDINNTESNNTDLNNTDLLPAAVAGSVSTSPALSREENIKRFEVWWQTYPKSEDKPQTERLYAEAILSGVSHEELLDGAKGYLRECRQEKRERQFIKYSVNWLREKRWNDNYPPAPQRLSRWQRAVAE